MTFDNKRSQLSALLEYWFTLTDKTKKFFVVIHKSSKNDPLGGLCNRSNEYFGV